MKSKLPPEVRAFFVQQGKKGGKLSGAARMEKLTAEQRREIARKAVQARWAKKKEEKEMDFDNYAVDCIRDDKHRERFVVVFANLAEGKIKRTLGPFDEKGVRAEMKEMGLTSEKIEDNLRRARAHADEKERTS